MSDILGNSLKEFRKFLDGICDIILKNFSGDDVEI